MSMQKVAPTFIVTGERLVDVIVEHFENGRIEELRKFIILNKFVARLDEPTARALKEFLRKSTTKDATKMTASMKASMSDPPCVQG